MRILRCAINHLIEPVGYDFGNVPTFTWAVEEAKGTRANASRIVVRTGDAMVADTGWADLDSLAAAVPLSLAPRTRYTWTVSVRTDADEEATSEANEFETGKMGEPWDARWLVCDGDDSRHPEFLTRVELEQKPIASARLYACGLGVYDAYLNDEHVGGEYLAPGTHAYDQWLQVQTYDVTEQLQAAGSGATLRFAMGNGWYKGRFGFIPVDKGFYGDDWRLIAELRVTYADGEEQVLGTGDGWTVVRSNVIFSNIYDGERRDDTLPEVAPEPAALLAYDEAEAATAKLHDRLSLPIVAHDTFVPALIRTPKGDTVLDLGQNISGTFRLRVHEPAGTTIRVQCSELLQDGEFYRDNLRSAKAEYVYVSDGEEHVLEPRFTFYGYRYARVEGIANLVPADFTGIALWSDFAEAGTLETGDALVNQLVSNATWGMRDNFLDTATDCPQRDERLGWTGDAEVFSQTALYLADAYPFYRKYLYDMALEQQKLDGATPVVVPAFMLSSPSPAAWGDATTIIPWNMYRQAGDPAILAEHFDAMRGWVDYIERVDGDRHGWAHDIFQFGDWLALDGPAGERLGGTDEGYVADLYYWQSARIVADAAAVLGRAEDEAHYRALAERVAAWIRDEYFSATGRCVVNTQTAYALALSFGFGDDEFSAAALQKLLARNDDKLSTGFVGTGFLTSALSDAGLARKAFGLLLNEEYPGWLFCVKQGATTIWERWNSLDETGHITGIDMNSMNHYSYGTIVGWLFSRVAGLMPLAPGFRRARIAPLTNWRLGHVNMTHATSAGTWRVNWHIVDEHHLRVELTVPFGCEAEVVLPAASESAYDELGGHTLAAGTYAVEYETLKPLRRVPSVDWTLSALMASPDTEAVVKRHCYHPEFMVGDPATAAKTIRELAPTFARGGGPMPAEAFDACQAELLALAE